VIELSGRCSCDVNLDRSDRAKRFGMAQVMTLDEYEDAECDVCREKRAKVVLRSLRLDGPLVRCCACGLYFVVSPAASFLFTSPDERRTTELNARYDELGIVRRDVEDAEDRLRLDAGYERLQRVRRYVASGKLLDVGCSKGFFLTAAAAHFDAIGVDPDPATTEQARAAGLRVHTGTIADVEPPLGGFDAITMFHVIEHLRSPRQALRLARDRLRPGGALIIETPTVETWWFRVAPRRWRQLLPDHYFFFAQHTLARLLADCGFQPVAYEKVGRRTSLRFAVDRLRRGGVPLANLAGAGLRRLGGEDRVVYLNPGDIMTMTALAGK
jgi:2-polyprenyl-3-methyl-5-hydroxy-6-metoxy-1,4-benzoquinol methylase